ncbi:Geminivirus AR1/BR1 coat protein [Gossypium australe]|uniref:Geminivirus AR1/BR1 coat protein n=1 Tax=Gossypium australe TaxID=47621 RepID=A0A5B6WDW1_9ROSI|nr:Geminivirus AR1/BR1 coat protein [Gossypium australe]
MKVEYSPFCAYTRKYGGVHGCTEVGLRGGAGAWRAHAWVSAALVVPETLEVFGNVKTFGPPDFGCLNMDLGISKQACYRSEMGASYIASALGIPLYMESIIAGQRRLSYVKVCVKTAANLVLPRSIDVELRDNFIATTSIESVRRTNAGSIVACGKEVVLEASRFKDYESLKTKKSSNKGKQVLTGSSNRFAILETVNLVEDQIIDRVEIETFEHTEIGKIGHGE